MAGRGQPDYPHREHIAWCWAVAGRSQRQQVLASSDRNHSVVSLIPNPRGGYRLLPGGEPYSSGVIAEVGFAIVHRTLEQLVPHREGFALIDEHLREFGRPRAALCALERRSPAPFTRGGFTEF